jgi:hypothetical protein
METRYEVEKILPEYDHIYIVYNNYFDRINNLEYFEELAGKLNETHNVHMDFDKWATQKWRLIAVK